MITIEIPNYTPEELLSHPHIFENIVKSSLQQMKQMAENPRSLVQHLTCEDGVTVWKCYEKQCGIKPEAEMSLGGNVNGK